MRKLFKLSLQFFGEDNGQQSQQNAQGQQQEEKTFTQTDVNNIVSRESKSAVEKLLKEAGIAADGDYKTALKAFKDWQDTQKTDLQKASDTLQAEKDARESAEKRAANLESRVVALGKGVPADKLDKYIKLAEAYSDDKTDFTTALDLAIKDFPIVAPGAPGAGGNPPPQGSEKKKLPSGTTFL